MWTHPRTFHMLIHTQTEAQWLYEHLLPTLGCVMLIGLCAATHQLRLSWHHKLAWLCLALLQLYGVVWQYYQHTAHQAWLVLFVVLWLHAGYALCSTLANVRPPESEPAYLEDEQIVNEWASVRHRPAGIHPVALPHAATSQRHIALLMRLLDRMTLAATPLCVVLCAEEHVLTAAQRYFGQCEQTNPYTHAHRRLNGSVLLLTPLQVPQGSFNVCVYYEMEPLKGSQLNTQHILVLK